MNLFGSNLRISLAGKELSARNLLLHKTMPGFLKPTNRRKYLKYKFPLRLQMSLYSNCNNISSRNNII